ncbi:hypothetical protein DSM106972_003960 [Dulcicalothrix desertica PCC 7102]|uniref:Uncharacterized protein n=1 Tax=Dulcicalothrix desertica PCC 7102 TaxID=232991 RepID=A0A3S1BDN4_9CYAN|nr:nuclease A inhibitor family protein [Dulcicalothrix desertica]RUT09901.1 hypothetical protein DSM106972_003960 [Dulcicalothrix desertica PCC 7102]TWH51083.1 nuclease A inhibitor-like protein [Dulcicalothrix desertica PCC 7102]
MKSSNIEFIQQVVKLTQNIHYRSQSDDGFEPFVWELAEKGDFTIEKFLKSEGFLYPVKCDDLLKYVSSEASWCGYDTPNPAETAAEMSLRYKELINFCNSNFKTTEIYLVRNLLIGSRRNPNTRKESLTKSLIGNPDLLYQLSINKKNQSEFYKRGIICCEQEAFHIILGETFEHDWVGIAPDMDMSGSTKRKGGKILPLPEKSTFLNTINLNNYIEKFVKNIDFPVIHFTARYTKKSAIVEMSHTKDNLLTRLLSSLQLLNISTFDDYSSLDLEEADKEKFRPLDEFLKSKLIDMREYTIGLGIVCDIYSIGRTIEGDLLGISTRANW